LKRKKNFRDGIDVEDVEGLVIAIGVPNVCFPKKAHCFRRFLLVSGFLAFLPMPTRQFPWDSSCQLDDRMCLDCHWFAKNGRNSVILFQCGILLILNLSTRQGQYGQPTFFLTGWKSRI
jgi:hypothetical protein